MPAGTAATAPGTGTATLAAVAASNLCDCCRFNRTIPDLSIRGNQQRWYRLEAAKRRSLYDLSVLKFPFGTEVDGVRPALGFEFKGDPIPDKTYRGMECGQKVYTGHDNGIITINIQEADDATREKLRVDFGEAKRSLLRHFRHELGHYVWDVLVKGELEPQFIAAFGDYRDPGYDAALQAYYQNGPKAEWLLNYVSAYATMHPWEDFAETFGLYLDMIAALDTARNGGLIRALDCSNLDQLITSYQTLGIALNEMNRSNGLLDYLPEVIAEPVQKKLRFIHELPRAQQSASTTQQPSGRVAKPSATSEPPILFIPADVGAQESVAAR